ncbi:MAG: tail fiber domain-containing protein [Myxococcota bacterium]
MMHRTRVAFLVGVAALVTSWEARAGSGAARRVIPYEATLEENGLPISATVPMVFSLYADSADQAPLWEESAVVDIQAGRFAVLLGNDATNALPDDVFSAPDLQLGLEINGTPLAGRQQLLPALLATHAAGSLDMTVKGGLTVQGAEPSVTLAQEASAGDGAQTFRLLASESGFFVEDITGGNRRPLQIRPGAPTSSLVVSASGRVGVGHPDPQQLLHVQGVDGATQLRVDELSGTTTSRSLLALRNNGGVKMSLEDSSTGSTWTVGLENGNLRMVRGILGVTAFNLEGSGNLTIGGTLTQNSDARLKEDLAVVERPLQRLASIRGWTYRRVDQPGEPRQMGLLAQEVERAFPEAVRVGPDGTRAVAYTSLVAPLVEAAHALDTRLTTTEQQTAQCQARLRTDAERIAALENALAERDARLKRLEEQVARLAARQP